jgi:predicted Zn finger-like uncharacterized protein
MYTFCPDCNRQYRIRAEQLSAAQGLVICGYCGRQFSALARLYDRPQKAPLQITEVNIEPVGVLVAHAPALREEVSGYIQGGHAGMTAAVKKEEPRFDLSEALLDKEQVVGGKARSSAWPAGVLVMFLLFMLQVAWFNRDDVLQAYPQLTPWVESLCERYQCNLFRLRDFSAIRILNRDVRMHPNYADTLLVNATMANQSGRTQPFPKIQFTLFDTNGQMLAYREFTAPEYLDHSIDVKKGMAPGQPVHFVLEITGPTQDAVSFEFRFL